MSQAPATSSDNQPVTSGDVKTVKQHIVEIVSDSGEGAQKAGQLFGTLCAKMGNGVWTVEIIPAEIKPPARSQAGASGIRIRVGSQEVTNMGDEADMVVAFNEQVLYGRIQQRAFRPGTILLLENRWENDPVPTVREQYAAAVKEFHELGYEVYELPMHEACKQHIADPRRGMNMFVVGMLSYLYTRDVGIAEAEVGIIFGKKGDKVIQANQRLVHAGFAFAKENLPFRFQIPTMTDTQPRIVCNGNQAMGLGIMAAGMEVMSMYPITPATSVSHYLGDGFPATGGFLHQAEDEIAAIGFAIGASYAGKTAATVTSGPGLALKTEFLGLAVMAEIPLFIGLVQRGGPSTGLPTKVEQGDLLACVYGATGDAPKVVIAAATIEECFHLVITARKLAETFRTPVILLTDANLATGVQPWKRPEPRADWFAPPIDTSPWDRSVPPYDWDPETGLSSRPVPGQPGGEYVLTGLAHTNFSKVAYDPDVNQASCEMRSRKLAALSRTLKAPEIYGDDQGDLLLVGWGSTMGSIQEAVDRAREEGKKVSAIQLRFLSPLEPGLLEIFKKFKKVMTVELNYSDPVAFEGADRRTGQLAMMLRASTLMDIDCWSRVPGQPLPPSMIKNEVIDKVLG